LSISGSKENSGVNEDRRSLETRDKSDCNLRSISLRDKEVEVVDDNVPREDTASPNDEVVNAFCNCVKSVSIDKVGVSIFVNQKLKKVETVDISSKQLSVSKLFEKGQFFYLLFHFIKMTSLPNGYIIRDAEEKDTQQIAEILKYYIRNTLATWAEGEAEEPTAESMLAKYRDFRKPASSSHLAPYPWLVIINESESDESESIHEIIGFAYAGPFRARAGWRFTCEDSIYLRPGYERRGLGKVLLSTLITRCKSLGYRKMVAVISVDGSGKGGKHACNDGLGLASVTLHKSLGFVEAGLFTNAGEKFNRIMDSLFLTLDIQEVVI
jgi:phosphinothricin acetyltransferase